MIKDQPLITISVPPEVDETYFRDVSLGFYKYQFFHVSDFWEGLEQLLYAAHRAGDVELLSKIGSDNLKIQDIPSVSEDKEVDSPPIENRSTIIKDGENQLTAYERIPVVIEGDFCRYQKDIWMNIPCSIKDCKHYCDNKEFFNCGYSSADIENPSEYSIAYRLSMPVEEVNAIIESGLNKLKQSILKDEYFEPLYDVLPVKGFCGCCNTLTNSDSEYCEECAESLSILGCDLVAKYKMPLDKILTSSFSYHKNINYQALALNVTVKDLQELYCRAGLVKNLDKIKPTTYLINKRPGRSIKIENAQYLFMNLISRFSYEPPSKNILSRLSNLRDRVNTFSNMESIADLC